MKTLIISLLLLIIGSGTFFVLGLWAAINPKPQIPDLYKRDVEYRVKRVLDSDTLKFDAWEVWRGQRYETIYRDKKTGCLTK